MFGTEDLAIALAVIKRRNPDLWQKWVLQVGKSTIPVSPMQLPPQAAKHDSRAAKPAAKEELVTLALVDRFMYKYVMGNSISRHLGPTCSFLNGRQFTFQGLAASKEIIKSLAIDVEDFEVTKQLLPNYRLLKWLFAVRLSNHRSQKISIHVVRSFQLVLASYYSFVAVPKKSASDICHLLLLGFMKNEILGFGPSKTRILKLLREYTNSRAIDQNDISFRSLCKGHSKMLALIINFMIQDDKIQALSDIMKFTLQLMESLVVCLIKVTRPKSGEIGNGKAFREIYRRRSTRMSYKYVRDFLDAAHHLEIGESARRMKACVELLLCLLASLQWDSMTDPDSKVLAVFQEHRSNLLSEFLVLDDLDLITRFLQLPWPYE
ncbi:LAFA_0A05908g1_1 [Lachancea sp. 'fantastica']|nr:LAFA_0A05908g1_1 [Lachancea sp. 'fantastica']